MIIKIFLIGWIILIGALIINVVAAKLKIVSWYDFVVLIQKVGLIQAFQKTSLISLIFLFILYPLLLGICAYLIFKFLP